MSGCRRANGARGKELGGKGSNEAVRGTGYQTHQETFRTPAGGGFNVSEAAVLVDRDPA